jgi:hypothetical protein
MVVKSPLNDETLEKRLEIYPQKMRTIKLFLCHRTHTFPRDIALARIFAGAYRSVSRAFHVDVFKLDSLSLPEKTYTAVYTRIKSIQKKRSPVPISHTKGSQVKNWVRKYDVPIARARVARLTRAIPRSVFAASHNQHAKILLSKSRHGTKLWASQNIFAGLFNFDFGPIWPYPRQNPMLRPRALAWLLGTMCGAHETF